MATDNELLIAALKLQRQALLRAIRTGALSVQHGDKKVQYRSLSEMQIALSGINDEIAELEGRPRKRVFYVNARRGY
jgi:hypothetical protein